MSSRPQDTLSTLANPDAYTWRPLSILSVYRMVIVASITALFLGTRGTPFMETEQPQLFLATVVTYLALSAILYVLVRVKWPAFRFQVYGQLLVDVVAIAILILASGTLGNGLGALMVVAVAGSSMLVSLRMSALFAAVASLTLLATQVLVDLEGSSPGVGYIQAGFLGMTVFITALLSALLARRARQNQALADRRGLDLQSLEALNGHIVQRLQAGVLALDGHDRVRLMNAAAWDFLGQPPRTRGMPIAELAPILAAALKDWHRGPAVDLGVVDINGRDLGVRLRPLGPDGDAGSLVFLEDVAALRAQVQEAKLASLGRLSASVAHEIRNPLGAMLHAAQLLQESDDLPQADRRLIEIIRNQGARLNRVVDSVLQMSRRQAPSPVRIPLGAWLSSFAEDFRAQFPQAGLIKLEVSVTPPELSVGFDPDHLHQVFSNLCRNAVEHGGSAQLTIRLDAYRAGSRVMLEVSDDGKGVDAEAAEGLFEPFHTTSPNGTGLGLYLCRELCESNSARLELAPSPWGARFQISILDVTAEAASS